MEYSTHQMFESCNELYDFNCIVLIIDNFQFWLFLYLITSGQPFSVQIQFSWIKCSFFQISKQNSGVCGTQ